MDRVGFSPKHPTVTDLCNGFWELHDVVLYVAPDGRAWIIDKGFRTDFGSIPSPIDWIPGMRGIESEADPAYLLHDWLYYSHRKGIDRCKDRADADRILLVALEVCGVVRWRRYAIYYGVRIGGSFAWNRKQKEVS